MSNPLGPNVVVTGASRGIGLAFVKEFIKLPDVQRVFACARAPDKAAPLKQVAASSKKVHLVKLDVVSDADISAAVAQIEKAVGEEGINVLVNNAGILSERGATFAAPDRATVLEHMNVNVVSPMMLTARLVPLLSKTASRSKPSIIVNISSDNGSVADATLVGCLHSNIAYGITKAALNMYTRYASVNAPTGVISVAVHPGWLRTDMGGSYAPLSVESGIGDVVKTLQSLSNKDNGRFIDQYGTDMRF